MGVRQSAGLHPREWFGAARKQVASNYYTGAPMHERLRWSKPSPEMCHGCVASGLSASPSLGGNGGLSTPAGRSHTQRDPENKAQRKRLAPADGRLPSSPFATHAMTVNNYSNYSGLESPEPARTHVQMPPRCSSLAAIPYQYQSTPWFCIPTIAWPLRACFRRQSLGL